MPIVSITTDAEQLTLTAIGEFPVSVQRLWQAWTDPRQLERFWGPPDWPATFTRHDMVVGGRSEYAMNGPGGEVSRGYWRVEALEPGVSFTVIEGFRNPDGTPDDGLPASRMRVRFEETAGGSRFVAVSAFASVEALEQILALGAAEGFETALAQLDGVLAEQTLEVAPSIKAVSG